jgi:hypothetical protein
LLVHALAFAGVRLIHAFDGSPDFVPQLASRMPRAGARGIDMLSDPNPAGAIAIPQGAMSAPAYAN